MSCNGSDETRPAMEQIRRAKRCRALKKEGYPLTNREAFNQFIRMDVERQIRFMENIEDEELVKFTIDHPGYHIETNIGDKLSYFKAMTAGMPVGPKDRVIAWFKEEAPEKIEWERIL